MYNGKHATQPMPLELTLLNLSSFNLNTYVSLLIKLLSQLYATTIVGCVGQLIVFFQKIILLT